MIRSEVATKAARLEGMFVWINMKTYTFFTFHGTFSNNAISHRIHDIHVSYICLHLVDLFYGKM